MAIISCPECQGKISDTVNQCIHCGAKIKICAECKSVYTDQVKTCSNCGYVFDDTDFAVSSETKAEVKNSKELVSKWKNNVPFINVAFGFWNFLELGSSLFLLLAILKLTGWSDPFEADSVLSGIKTYLVFAVVFFMVGASENLFAPSLKGMMMSNWCRSNGLNLKTAIINGIQTDFDAIPTKDAETELDYLGQCIKAEFYTNENASRSKLMGFRIASLAASLVPAILLYSFLTKNVEIYMRAELMKSDILNIPGFEFSMIENWWLVIAAAVIYIVIVPMLKKYVKSIEEAAIESWFVQSFPEHEALYQKYGKASGVEVYLLKREGIL